MRLARLISASLIACICVAIGAAGATAQPGLAKPVVLMLHAGGFIFTDPTSMAVATEVARDAGFEPVYVDYPLYDLRGAVRAVETAAEAEPANRAVCAYGESAGGSLAGLLAERGFVDAAAAYSPIPNLASFIAHNENPDYYMQMIHADRELLLHDSPALHGSAREILAFRASHDDGYVRAGIGRWAQRDPEVEVRNVAGEHIGYGDPAAYRRHVATAMRWLNARC